MRDLIDRFTTDLTILDRKVVFSLLYTAFGLGAIFYLKEPENINSLLRHASSPWLFYSSSNNLPVLGLWAAVATTFYFIIPAIAIRYFFRESLSDYGLNIRIENGFGRLVATAFAIMLPIVYLMSLTNSFADKYPFLKIYDGEPYLGTTLLIWELIYFVQFFGLEFFFRGFLVHSLKPALGIYSIFAMTVPYTMIHFGKPPAETFAAIIAGVLLGWMSYRNGTIWLGFALHCGVAFSMDVLALYNRGVLF